MGNEKEVDDSFARGFSGMKDADELKEMSDYVLAGERAKYASDSAEFAYIDDLIKRRLVDYQTIANRKNICIGTCIGGIFTIIGVITGWFLRGI